MATKDITEAEFEQTLEDNDIVFVDFWADWCGPCKMFAPVYEQISEENPDVVFAKVDTEAERGLAAAANITSIPTLMAFRDKILVYAQPGAVNAQQLQELVNGVKAIDMDEVRQQLAEQQAAAGEAPEQGPAS